MSGYFSPIDSQVPEGNKPGAKPEQVDVFRGHPALRLLNSPQDYVTSVPIDDVLPAFWLAAGAEDRSDVRAAEDFRQLLETRVADVPFVIIPGGGHQGSVWRAALGPMLAWMTPQLAENAEKADLAAARAAAAAKAAAERRARAHVAKPRPTSQASPVNTDARPLPVLLARTTAIELQGFSQLAPGVAS
jgi:hypothetical protein